MPPSTERNDFNAALPEIITWLMNQVLKLPTDARSSLRVESFPLVGFTDVRHAAHGNQDRIALAYSVESNVTSNWLLAVVCDGVGGSSHGERAAAMAVASMALDMAGLRRMGAINMLREALQNAHVRTSSAFHSKSSTTAVALLVTGESAAIGWIGDSRAYQISEGKVRLLTTDDTLASAVARADSTLEFELNEEYADRLSQAIGAEGSVTPNVIAWQPSSSGAHCMLCTDGIWKPTEGALDAMANVCRDGQELMRRLLLVSDWMGGLDNASAILVPPLDVVREFICDPANMTPKGGVVVCLPGPQQTLLPALSLLDSAGLTRIRNQDRRLDESNESTYNSKKAPTKRRGGGSSKIRSTSGAGTAGQLVIAEEPLDDTSPHPPGKIPGDGTST
ncbi:PP2C family protein-serine/threonine phosphatase [Variovorax guangxiensis]|uniref:Serine/threonine protein phosphatase PrpC n=1 Tax=Variovorax guangxiensis TaxID=1775474 RepID=A0A840FWY1_9BURK|nr:protein phosphatase 2C domain-containing protein [Variovorax guangxiensis]MBB4223929.1 serine/threonine protein phosphatase PrpC [Variovorax guangxiensis]